MAAKRPREPLAEHVKHTGEPLTDGPEPALPGCDFATSAKITVRDLPRTSGQV
jgi:hypothetical protein